MTINYSEASEPEKKKGGGDLNGLFFFSFLQQIQKLTEKLSFFFHVTKTALNLIGIAIRESQGSDWLELI